LKYNYDFQSTKIATSDQHTGMDSVTFFREKSRNFAQFLTGLFYIFFWKIEVDHSTHEH